MTIFIIRNDFANGTNKSNTSQNIENSDYLDSYEYQKTVMVVRIITNMMKVIGTVLVMGKRRGGGGKALVSPATGLVKRGRLLNRLYA